MTSGNCVPPEPPKKLKKPAPARLWVVQFFGGFGGEGFQGDVARISLGYRSDTARISLGYRSGIARIPLGCRSDVARVSLGYRSDAARIPLGHRSDAARIPLGYPRGREHFPRLGQCSGPFLRENVQVLFRFCSSETAVLLEQNLNKT